jgi:hypothetical protein
MYEQISSFNVVLICVQSYKYIAERSADGNPHQCSPYIDRTTSSVNIKAETKKEWNLVFDVNMETVGCREKSTEIEGFSQIGNYYSMKLSKSDEMSIR